MDLRHLRHFITLAETGSLHQAARRLRLHQPALSQSIRTLEADVGTLLVDRRPTGTRLTLAGKIFLKEAQTILSSLDRAVQITRQAGIGVDVSLRLGITRDIVTNRLTAVLSRFQNFSSYGQVIVSDATESHHQSMLSNGLLDLLLLPGTISADDAVTDPIWWEELHLALPISHPLTEHSVINLNHLRDIPIILGAGDYLRTPDRILTKACHEIGIQFSPTVITHHLEVRLMLVAAGSGLTPLLASNLILGAATGIVSRPFHPPLRMMVTAAWPPSGLTLAAQRFLDLARNIDMNDPPP